MRSTIWGPEKQHFIMQLLEICPLTGNLDCTYTHIFKKNNNKKTLPTHLFLRHFAKSINFICLHVFYSIPHRPTSRKHTRLHVHESKHSNVTYTSSLWGCNPDPKALQCDIKNPDSLPLGTWIPNMETNKMAAVSPTEGVVPRLPSEWS